MLERWWNKRHESEFIDDSKFKSNWISLYISLLRIYFNLQHENKQKFTILRWNIWNLIVFLLLMCSLSSSYIISKIKICCYGQIQAIKQCSVHPCWEKCDMTANQDTRLKTQPKWYNQKGDLKLWNSNYIDHSSGLGEASNSARVLTTQLIPSNYMYSKYCIDHQWESNCWVCN